MWNLIQSMNLQKVLFLLLHIKLGLVKNIVIALSRESVALKYLPEVFPMLSEAIVKAGSFVCLTKVRKIIDSLKSLKGRKN